MAYIIMPILFAVSGYTLIQRTTAPMLRLMNTTLEMILVEEAPDHYYELRTIYNVDAGSGNKSNSKSVTQSGTDQACLNESKIEVTKTADIVKMMDIQFPELGEHYAMLICERIQLEVPVYWGDTQKILSAGVGHFMGSFLPGFNRSILLSAHNNTYFKALETIQVGDIVNYATNYGEFQYRIDEVSIINAEDAEIMLDNMLGLFGEKLIMYTCYPFNPFDNNKEKRLFAFGNKLSGPEVEK